MLKRILTTSIAAALAASSAQAGNLYWDINGASPGATDTTFVPGTWGTDDFWSTDPTGASATGAYVEGSDVFFSAGTNGIGIGSPTPSIIPVDGAFVVNSITFQEGAIQVGGAGPVDSALLLGAGGITLNAGLQGNATFSASINDGILLTASQTWTNNTTGTGTTRNLQVNAPVFVDEGNVTLTIAGTGQTTIGQPGFGGITNSGTGSISIVKEGAGVMTINIGNNYSGPTTINAGSLIISHANALGSGAAGTTVNSGAYLALTGGVITNASESLTLIGPGNNSSGALTTNFNSAGGNWAGEITLGSSDARVGARSNTTLTISGGIKGSGTFQSIVFNGEGTPSDTTTAGTVIFASPAGASTYTGETRLVRGTVKLGADNALPTTTIVDMHVAGGTDPSTFDLNGFNQTIAGLKRSINGTPSTVTNSALGDVKTLTLNQSTDLSFGGTDASAVITGNLALEKTGSGTFTMNSANSYSGGTILAGGSITGKIGVVFGTGNVTVKSTAKTLTIETGVLDAIADTAILSLAGGGTAGVADAGYITLGDGVNETVFSLVLGGITFGPGVYGSSAAIGVSTYNDFFAGSGTITVVPEPTSGLLMLASVGSLLGVSRLRRTRR